MIWLKLIVGSKLGRTVAVVLAATLILSLTILWYRNTIENQVLQGVEIQQAKDQIKTRDKIDEAVRTSPRERDAAVEWLRKRNSGK